MQGLGRNNEFVWRYDLEEEDFVHNIISMAQPVHLWDGPDLTYATLLRDNPHRAYVIAIEYRTLIIVDRFKSLNILDRMFAYDRLPIATRDGSIFRDDWIRITLDVLLSRLTSIRDCCFLFVSEIYELGLEPRRVNLESLKKLLKDNKVLDLLIEIADTARSVREERDRHLHRGEERPLLGELDQLFQMAARSEGGPVPCPKLTFFDPSTRTSPVELNLPEIHAKIISEIRSEYYQDGDRLITLTRELFLAAKHEFESRWTNKRDGSVHVRSWERSSGSHS